MNYIHNYNPRTIDEWDDLVWLIQRGKVEKIIDEIPINQSFHASSKLKETGEQVLHVCAEYENLILFDWFEETYNISVTALNDYDETPFMIAAREGKMKIIRLYKMSYMEEKKFGFNVDQKNKDGWSAVQFAAINSFISIVEFMVKEMGADVNTVDRNNRSMLHWASRYGNAKLTDALLKMDIKYNV